MNRSYDFGVSAEDRTFCDEIVDEMIRTFGVAEAEAVGRVNRQWRGIDFEPDDLRLHETEEFWAKDIYFGHDSYWWRAPPDLRPKPFP